MRIADFLRKGGIKTHAGDIVNRVKLRPRRITLFFEEIGAGYVKACEDAGYAAEMEEIGERWMALYFGSLLPSSFRKLPPKFFLNVIIKKIWVSVYLMDYFHMREDAGLFEITTRNEGLTRIVGSNSLMKGFYRGILGSLYGFRFAMVEAEQSTGECRYVFRRTGERMSITGKSRQLYDKLNRTDASDDFTLRDALKTKVFEMKGNAISFRGKSISPIESTLFHLIGNKGIMSGCVADVSKSFFNGIVESNADDIKKAQLLKTLLQVMGWGIVSIEMKAKEIIVLIKNPACGLQLEKDNWDFLSQTILGYLRIFEPGLFLSGYDYAGRRLKLVYSVHQ
ncbi:MAG: hypothetical protein NTU57_00920 [Candidatus Aenigmarchaeota archaeon]|nr:hypothetical protein [Candidatus Aenigmarchaeota archaeon]